MPKAIAQPPWHHTTFEDRLEGVEGQLLKATFDLVAENGLDATSTRAITDRAGLSRGLLHYHFQTKQRLLARLLELLFENYTRNLEMVAAADLAPDQKLKVVMELGLDWVAGDRRQEFVVTMAFWGEAMAQGGRMLDLHSGLVRRYRETLIGILEEAELAGLIAQGSSRDVASLMVAIVQGLGLQYNLAPSEFPAAAWAGIDQILRTGASALRTEGHQTESDSTKAGGGE